MELVKIQNKYQITLPKAVRNSLGLKVTERCLFREVHKDTGLPKGGPALQGERRRRDHQKRTGTLELTNQHGLLVLPGYCLEASPWQEQYNGIGGSVGPLS